MASHSGPPSSQGNSSQNPQCGMLFSIAHCLILHSQQERLLTPGARHPVHLTFDGSMKGFSSSPSRDEAMRARASVSFAAVALRASHAPQSMPQQPMLSVRLKFRTPVYLRPALPMPTVCTL